MAYVPAIGLTHPHDDISFARPAARPRCHNSKQPIKIDSGIRNAPKTRRLVRCDPWHPNGQLAAAWSKAILYGLEAEPGMRRFPVAILAVASMIGGTLLSPIEPSLAGDLRNRPHSARSQELPFPRSERSQSIRTSSACWSECGSYCAWGLAGCLEQDTQGRCIKLTDTCDRYCQRSCRGSGGPLLAIDF